VSLTAEGVDEASLLPCFDVEFGVERTASCPDAWTAWTQDREDTHKAGACVRICRVAGDDVSLAHARTCAESWWRGQRAGQPQVW